METCKNCDTQFNDNYNFCPNCGQQVKDELTVKVLFYNTINNYFSFDARFFKSFLPLLFKPGFIAKKFVQGKRLIYLHPAQMYLFIAVVFFFLFSFIQRKQVEAFDEGLAQAFKKEGSGIQEVNFQQQADSIAALVNAKNSNRNTSLNFGFKKQKVDSLLKIGVPKDTIYKAMGLKKDANAFERRLYKQALKFYESKRGGGIMQTFYDAIPIAMFFLLPIFALILKLLYFKKGRYAHHLVFSFYYFAFLFTVFSIIIGSNFLFDIPNGVDFLIMLSTFIYLVLALRHFYVQGWIKSIIKGILASFVFLSIVAPIAFAVLCVFAFMFY
ncbi:DUF3667 domain-containing protein [Flavobacteriaceae bacterium MHTCC 0001]